jgi:hypothetical protein
MQPTVADRRGAAVQPEQRLAPRHEIADVGHELDDAVSPLRFRDQRFHVHREHDAGGAVMIDGIDESVRPGYESIQYTVRISGNGTEEQFREIHDTVIKTSPNYFNVSRPIRLDAELVVG